MKQKLVINTKIMKNRLLTFLSILCLVLLSAGQAVAQVLISQDFQVPLGGLPSDWNVNQESGNGFTEISPWRVADSWAPTNGLLMERTNPSSNYRANAYYNGEGASGLNDYTGAVTMLVDTRHSYGGALLRMNRVVRNGTEAYFVGVLAGGDEADQLVISLDPQSHNNPGTILASTSLSEPVTGMTTRLGFLAIGDEISVSIYLWDVLVSDWSTNALATLTISDSTYSSGQVGLRGGFGSADRYAQFADYSITAIPEPRVYAIGVGIAVLLLTITRRRR